MGDMRFAHGLIASDPKPVSFTSSGKIGMFCCSRLLLNGSTLHLPISVLTKATVEHTLAHCSARKGSVETFSCKRLFVNGASVE